MYIVWAFVLFFAIAISWKVAVAGLLLWIAAQATIVGLPKPEPEVKVKVRKRRKRRTS